ncbi:MAG: YbaK/EbsC family protein [Microthrixaceae bacterium]
MHANVERFLEAAATRGLAIDPSRFPEGTRTAQDAAAAVGCDVGQIVKSLVFVLDAAPVVALVSGSNRLDEQKLATTLGGEQVRRADAEVVRDSTSYPIGGVPPFGHSSDLPTAIDRDLLAHDVVWAAAGTPNDVFAVDPAELVRVCGATVGDLAVEDSS